MQHRVVVQLSGLRRAQVPLLAIAILLHRNRLLADIRELAVALLDVLHPRTLVSVAGLGVRNLAMAVLHSVDELALVNVSVGRSDFALALQLTFEELALVKLAILSKVERALAGNLPLTEFSLILVSVWLLQLALAILHAVHERALVSVGTILPRLLTITVVGIVGPFTFVE